MCGIATIAIGRSSRERIPYHKLQALASELLWELQPRGMDASGIAVVNDPGTEGSVVFKKPLMPDRLVVRPAFTEACARIGPHTNFVLLHARATTVGNTSNNFNNHPIIIPGCIGIHNGTLYNHERLFKAFKKKFSQGGDVDSEIIFRLFKYHSDQGLSPEQAMQETSKHLWGAFTGAVIDWNNPSRMVMFKNDRSLCIIRIPYYDIVITVSEPQFYTRAAKRLKLLSKVDCEYVYDGTGFVIDVNISEKITKNIADFSLPVQSRGVSRNHNGWIRHYLR